MLLLKSETAVRGRPRLLPPALCGAPCSPQLAPCASGLPAARWLGGQRFAVSGEPAAVGRRQRGEATGTRAPACVRAGHVLAHGCKRECSCFVHG